MWLNPQFPAYLVTFTEEILNGKLHFLCSVNYYHKDKSLIKVKVLCSMLVKVLFSYYFKLTNEWYRLSMVSSNFYGQRGLQTSCGHVCLQMNWITLLWTCLTLAFFLKMKFLVIDITGEATTIYANN